MILHAENTYTFSQIFELRRETDEVLAELGYEYRIIPLTLPTAPLTSAQTIAQIGTQMRDRLPHVPLINETARREFYVSPVLFTALDQAKFKMSIEYALQGQRLRGAVDYLLRGTHNVLIVEAKNADMERGFTQLAAEMIAFAEHRPDTPSLIYGAVTTGDLWRFGILDRTHKMISKDLDEYLLPRDLEQLLMILVGLLANK